MRYLVRAGLNEAFREQGCIRRKVCPLTLLLAVANRTATAEMSSLVSAPDQRLL